jgi:hypothetical protein
MGCTVEHSTFLIRKRKGSVDNSDIFNQCGLPLHCNGSVSISMHSTWLVADLILRLRKAVRMARIRSQQNVLLEPISPFCSKAKKISGQSQSLPSKPSICGEGADQFATVTQRPAAFLPNGTTPSATDGDNACNGGPPSHPFFPFRGKVFKLSQEAGTHHMPHLFVH